jgi:DNA-binding CsgD family transcriptional regulator
MASVTRFRNSLLQEVAQCLMRLVEARTVADATQALAGFLEGLPITWYTVDVFAESKLRKRVASRRCPRRFAPFVTRMGFLKRQDGTYQGTFAESTIVLVKAGSPWTSERCLVCAAGFAKDSPLNDGTVMACIGALIHEGLSRVAWLESDAIRLAALGAYADHNDDVIAVFDVHGRLVEQYPAAGRATLPPSLFQAATAQSARKRSSLPQPVVMSSDGRVYEVRSRWVTTERVLDSRYLLVHARTRPAAPVAVIERLKNYGLSRRESQVAELVFIGQTNQLVADTLFISRDTVKTHCKHIFGKLGISRRTEFLRVIGESSRAATSGSSGSD